MKNRYFLGKDIDSVLDCIVGSKEDQRPISKDGFWLIKLFEGDCEDHECLNVWHSIKSKDELIKELKNDRWE